MKNICIVFLNLYYLMSLGQADVPFNNIESYISFYNPSIVASKEKAQLSSGVVVNSSKKENFLSSQTSSFFTGSGVILDREKKNHGLGIFIKHYDLQSFFYRVNIVLNYGLKMSITEKTKLSLGASFKVNYTEYGGFPFYSAFYYDDFDPVFNSGFLNNNTNLDSNIGSFLEHGKHKAGLSFLNIVQNQSINNDTEFLGEFVSYNPERLHFYYSYNMNLDSSGWVIKPLLQTIVYNDFNMLNMIGLKVQNDLISLGVLHKKSASIVFLAGIKVKKFNFSYSYEYFTNELRSIAGFVSQEFYLSYALNKKKG